MRIATSETIESERIAGTDASEGRVAAVPRGPAASERRGRGADKRRRIVASAVRVFAAKGYHETRISDIAREAKIAYGLVYHYFKNKEEILDTIFFERWGAFIQTVQSIVDDDRRAEEKLLAIASVILTAHRLHPEWVKILVFEIQRTQRFADPARVREARRLLALIARVLEDGQVRGELRADLDPAIASSVFAGGLDVVVTHRALGQLEVRGDPAEHDAQMARTVVDLFLHGMGGGSTDAAAGAGST